jgi:hypothetical protein
VPLWITEGQKKADALAVHGLCAADLLGVWNFKGKNEFGGVTLLADFDYIALNGRTVYVVFDSDLMVKSQVRAALDRLTEHLQRRGAIVNAVYLPIGPDGAKAGVDDYLLTHTVADLEALATKPPAAPKAAAPMVELMDEAPPTLSRPLALIDGCAYAATWLWVKKTVRETLDKQGKVVRHDPPLEDRARERFIVRDDGQVFGPDQMDDLGLQVSLSDIPPEDKLWRTAGVKAYRSGTRPVFPGVFVRVSSVYDFFIDFAHSLADQARMAELSACFSLATWFCQAFTVLGYPWPNGDKGAGKTKWGTCWANTSYLGMVVLDSTTFPVLRDLADYGATLLFDDAENLVDPKRAQPEKRALMLAGNRRGAFLGVKEPTPDGRGWRTRYLNAFCPRGFTAIRLPDPVLGSRSVRIPLVRTADRKRGNSDPADFGRWPCDWRQLQDDLWATGLALLPEAGRVWAELDGEIELTGREFEPWRAIIAVSRLFERYGVNGLEGRMREVMRAYQEEKADLDTGDRAVQVLRAILYEWLGDKGLDILDVSDVSDVFPGGPEQVKFNSSNLAATIQQIGSLEGFDTDWVSPNTVGWQLTWLRFARERDPNSRKRTRFRTMSAEGLLALFDAYGLVRWGPVANSQVFKGEPHPENVQIGQNVQNVQQADHGQEEDDVVRV